MPHRSERTPRRWVAVARALTAAYLLALADGAAAETWVQVARENPAIEVPDYMRFTRASNEVHYIRPRDPPLSTDIAFTWTDPPATIEADQRYTIHVTSRVAGGRDECNSPYVGARVGVDTEPCHFCTAGGEVGGGNCGVGEGDFSSSIPVGNFNQTEARVHVYITDGSFFGGMIATYVYQRQAGDTPTAERTPARTATRTATRTPTEPEPGRIACGERVDGTLGPGDDEAFYGDGTWADLRSLHLTATTEVTVSMEADGYEAYVGIYDAVDLQPRASGFSTATVVLPPGDYIVAANNVYPLAAAAWPYTLRVDCVGEEVATPTETRTPTRTHTATATATRMSEATATASPTATAPIDFVADALEVVQSVQDLENRVELISGKRTFVRFYVHATRERYRPTATLFAQRGGSTVTLRPVNAGGRSSVGREPNRRTLSGAFLFELPEGFRDGVVELTAHVNPDFELPETSTQNNVAEETAIFSPPVRMNLVLFAVGYGSEEQHYPPARDLRLLVEWLRAAYPVTEVTVRVRSIFASEALPECLSLNTALLAIRAWDRLFAGIPADAHYYGMVSDAGGFMRGCALPALPVSSGPTGNPTGTRWAPWDTDDTYGDWYGAHELGHTYGGAHTGTHGDFVIFRGYPYSGAQISPTLVDGPDTVYGFDARTFAIYPPTWNDVMSYCDELWVSDYHYRIFANALRAGSAGASLITSALDQLLVVGAIEDGHVELRSLFVVPGGAPSESPPGDYALIQRDAAGTELARRTFAPAAVLDGPPLEFDPDPPRRAAALFALVVPYEPGTARVEIAGPDGGVLATIRAGMSDPVVTLVAPNGGTLPAGDRVTVAWEASDPDGDALVFNVQYSPDDGALWELIAENVAAPNVEVDRATLRASARGRFRVWASDGIHSASDASDGVVTVPNLPPEVRLVTPADRAVVAAGQTVALEAEAYDRDGGRLDAQHVGWESSRDGWLGAGSSLSVATLSVGLHEVTVRADDGDGGTASAAVRVRIVAGLAELPPSCAGDCDNDGAVSIAELITGVNMALGVQPVEGCQAFDLDGSSAVAVNELVAAVNAALAGC